jgi:hypothetical protein
MDLPDPDSHSRRDYLRGLVAAGGAVGLSACLDFVEREPPPAGDPAERPASQHAWNDALDTDEHGNVLSPEHHVLVALDLAGDPAAADRQRVADAFRSLERAYPYDSDGLLFTVGYGPSYFERVGADAPIPEPEAVTNIESPDFDEFDALVHLASDRAEVVLEAEAALFGEAEPEAAEMDATLDGVFERRPERRRTGFVGDGLPAEFADEVGGVPDEMPDEAPFFMGFKSGFENSQAPEERVTIQEGPYEGGTTTHVESLDLDLQQWFGQDDHWLRVAQTFSPAHAEAGLVSDTGDDLGGSSGIEPYVDQVAEDARERGVVGHAQKAARARDEDGTPPLLRRDFNTTDGGVPGSHFLVHQRSIDEFVRVRRAMAGQDLDGGVGQRHNNGLLQYIFVQRRGNFLVPPREKRALPALD